MAMLPAAIPYIMAATAAISAVGAYQQGSAARKAADFNAAVQRQNAEQALARSRLKQSQLERENVLRLGLIRANQGASGGTAEGSVLDVLGDVAAQGELERQYVAYQGEAIARGHAITGELDVFQGETSQQAGRIGAASELLKGAGNTYSAMNRTR